MIRTVFYNDDDRRLRAGWRLLLQALLMVVFVIGAGAFLLPTVGGRLGEALASLVGIGGSVWLAAAMLDGRRLADFGLHLSRRWWADLGFGLALGVVFQAAIFGVEWALGWVEVVDVFVVRRPEQPFLLAVLTPLTVFVAVGVYEELLARGYWLRNVAEGLGGVLGPRGALLTAWVVSSALFGLAHAFNPNATLVSTINLVAAGLFLGLGTVLTGSLAISIGLHVTWNFAEGILFGFPVSGQTAFATAQVLAIEQHGPDVWTGGAFGPEAGLLTLVGMALGSAATVAWVRRRHGTVRLRDELAQYDDDDAVRHPASRRRVEG